MNKKSIKNNQILIIIFGLCICIFFYGIVFPVTQFTTLDNVKSSISQILDLEEGYSLIPVPVKFSLQIALFESFLYASRQMIYMSTAPQNIHGRSPPVV